MNSKEHLIGATVAWFIVTLYGVFQLESFFTDALVLSIPGLVLTVIGGATADIIEPATGPDHRAFFHSVLFGLLLLLLVIYCLTNLTPLTLLILYGTSGYLSHLLLDATTPKGLPL